MNDERLTSALGSLRHERMDRIADDKIRARLENAWSARAERRSFGSRLRRFAPVLATLALFVGLGGTTMNAAGDSPLYGFRIAIENASVALHADPADREEFLMQLLDQRQAEAARLEATGNAAAASRAREIERETLAMLPQAPEVEPAPLPAASDTPTPSASPTPTVAPTVSPTVAPTTARTPTPRPPTPTPTRTPTPTVRTPTPPPTPTGSPMVVRANGIVKNSDGTPAASVCVKLELSSAGCVITSSTDGTYAFAFSGRLNQSVTIYFTRQDGSIMWKAYTTIVVKGTTVAVPTVKLAKV